MVNRLKINSLLISIAIITMFAGSLLLWIGLNNNLIRNQPQETIITITPSPTLIATQSGQEKRVEFNDTLGQKVLVKRVVDGDTVEIEGDLRIRYIGVDTPETVDPRRSVECFGKEAKEKNKELVESKVVILQKDVSETDKYGRLLRYVYLPISKDKMLFVNDYLIREGYAKVLTYPPDVKFSEQFVEAEKEARQNKKGLWGRC